MKKTIAAAVVLLLACSKGSAPRPHASSESPTLATRTLARLAPEFARGLSEAAVERTHHFVVYNGAYISLDYPGGDPPPRIGVCTDVVIRSYRTLDIDLQREVHEDMKQFFDLYPRKWGLKSTDTNIDHRRVLNLEVFFSRKGVLIPVTADSADYLPGDIVSWRLDSGLPHIGVVVDRHSTDGRRPLVVHNIGWGPKLEDFLFSAKIVGHYRYGALEKR